MNLKTRSHSLVARFSVIIGALCLSCLSTAQNLSAIGGAQDGLFAISEKKDKTYLDIGVAYLNRSSYVGSENSDTLILPFTRAEYKGRFFLKPAVGGGIYWRNTDNIRLSTSINFVSGRDDEDVDLFEGGEVDSSFGVTNSVRIYTPIGALEANITTPFTGDFDGTRLDTLFTTEIKPIEGLRITPGVRATFGTSGFVNTLYEMSEADLTNIEAAGIDPFEADSGLIALGAHAAAYYELPKKFQLIGIANYSILQGDARDSPLSPDNNGLTFAIAIARHF